MHRHRTLRNPKSLESVHRQNRRVHRNRHRTNLPCSGPSRSGIPGQRTIHAIRWSRIALGSRILRVHASPHPSSRNGRRRRRAESLPRPPRENRITRRRRAPSMDAAHPITVWRYHRIGRFRERLRCRVMRCRTTLLGSPLGPNSPQFRYRNSVSVRKRPNRIGRNLGSRIGSILRRRSVLAPTARSLPIGKPPSSGHRTMDRSGIREARSVIRGPCAAMSYPRAVRRRMMFAARSTRAGGVIGFGRIGPTRIGWCRSPRSPSLMPSPRSTFDGMRIRRAARSRSRGSRFT